MTQHYLTSVINTGFVKLNQNTVVIKVSLKKESLQNYEAVNFCKFLNQTLKKVNKKII